MHEFLSAVLLELIRSPSVQRIISVSVSPAYRDCNQLSRSCNLRLSRLIAVFLLRCGAAIFIKMSNRDSIISRLLFIATADRPSDDGNMRIFRNGSQRCANCEDVVSFPDRHIGNGARGVCRPRKRCKSIHHWRPIRQRFVCTRSGKARKVHCAGPLEENSDRIIRKD